MCVKAYIYISLFWRCYYKCGVFGKQFFFFFFVFLSFFLSFFFEKKLIVNKYNLFWHYFRSGIGSTYNKCKKMYKTHCIVHLIHLYSPWRCRRVETHECTFLDLDKQTDRLYKLLDDQKNHTNRDQSLTLTKCFLHYHLDCRGCVISRARAVSIANLVMIRKGSS